MTPSPLPEIMRSNLTEVVLQLKEFGIEKPEEFDFLDSPDPAFSASLSSPLPSFRHIYPSLFLLNQYLTPASDLSFL
jgi:hypothetical protein